MNNITPFDFEGSSVRVVDIDGEPWFVASDVCKILCIEKYRDAVARLDPDERGSVKVDTLGGPQNVAAVNESGLYTLILRCRDAASPGTIPHRLRKWVTTEVLPAIRKTGHYGAPTPDLLADPGWLRQALLSYTEKVIALETTVAEQTPKVLAFDRLDDATGSMCITDAAKTLKVGPKQLFKTLERMEWIYRRNGSPWKAYQSQIDCGRLEHKISTFEISGGITKTRTAVAVTPKGMKYLAEKITSYETNMEGYF